MGSIAGDDVGFGGGGGIGKEVERILVSVRVRPLNGKEVERNDPSDWECINNTTIIFKNSLPERSMFPTAYTYDRVFGYECNTRQVYEEGAKEVVLSVVSGINSSIFAYGQTSSGKTYTMTGITEHSVADIYDYIQKHKEREFVLKFSAMEIYNESVRDLLSMDSTPLRLLDDPEKGTTVEKLTEETLRDRDHLKELLSVCEAQRQIGETSLNEMSSRSHQILRLTIESSAKEYLGRDNSSTLAATVNFVDLAGSERASQALSAGTRLKEGCHINRSLLTLGTVIRKLSKGRNGHIPYRDSKLTRILQTSLGGNSRTAIICTMSPARSHVEQSRNTLLFASCAKEVVTSAQVNVVMSDKALVKQLQRELARLESELRYSGSSCTTNHSDALREKEARIKKMEKEMKELIQQRDLAQSRLEDLLQAVGNDHTSRQWEELSQSSMPHALNACEDTSSISETSSIAYQSPEFSTTSFRISHGNNSRKPKEKHALSPLRHSASSPSFVEQEKISDDSSEEFEDHCREVRCIEMDEPSMNRIEDFNLLSTEDIDSLLPSTAEATEYVDPDPIFKEDRDLTHAVEQEVSLKAIDNLVRPQPGDNGFKAVDDLVIPQPGDNSFKAVDNLFRPQPDELSQLSLAKELNSSRRSILTRSRSCRAALMNNSSSPWFQDVEQENNTPPNDFFKDFSGRPAGVHKRLISLNYDGHVEAQSGDASHNSEQNATVDVLKPQNMNAPEEGITSISNFVAGLKEMAKIQYQKKLSDEQETERTSNKDPEAKRTIKDVCLEPVVNPSESPSSWPVEFKKKQQEIVELWHACNVSLIHRTYFFLLFKGCDSSDSIYIEVEHRRLSFLRNSSSQRSLNKTAAEDSQNLTLSTSLKNLRREREMLYRQMHKRLSSEERRSLYTEWGIALDSKQRRLQLVRRLWSEPKDMEHVRESASLVAKLIGLVEPGQALKEMFALSFAPQQIHRRSYSWRTGTSSLR